MAPGIRFYFLGILLFLLYAHIIIWPAFLFLLNIPLNSFEFPLSVVSWFISGWYIQKHLFGNSKKGDYFFNTAFAGFIFALTLIFTQGFYDTSFDGNWYHMDAVYNIMAGWNPVYTQLLPEQTSYCEPYLNHFPKCSWIYGANVSMFFGLIETGKSGTLLLIIAGLFIWQQVAREALKLNTMASWVFSLLIAANPVQMLNILTFYTDGQLSSMFAIAIGFALLFARNKNGFNLTLALLALALLANYKFTSAIYAGILAFFLFIYCWNQHFKNYKKLLIIFTCWGIFTYVIIGFNPYITNTIHHQHPFYPLSESSERVFSKKDIYPANFLEMNWFQKFFNSVFAEPSWNRNPDNSHLKVLFGHTNLHSYTGGVPDLAGFGPMVPEVLVLLIPAFLFACFFKSNKKILPVLLFMGVLASTIIINPEAWVLRYVPQFWLFILAMLYVVWIHPKVKYLAWLLAFGLLMNAYMITREYIQSNYDKTHALEAQFDLIKQDLFQYQIYHGWTNSFRNRLGAVGFDTAHLVWIPPEDSTSIEFVGSLGARFRKIK